MVSGGVVGVATRRRERCVALLFCDFLEKLSLGVLVDTKGRVLSALLVGEGDDNATIVAEAEVESSSAIIGLCLLALLHSKDAFSLSFNERERERGWFAFFSRGSRALRASLKWVRATVGCVCLRLFTFQN